MFQYSIGLLNGRNVLMKNATDDGGDDDHDIGIDWETMQTNCDASPQKWDRNTDIRTNIYIYKYIYI